MIKHAFQRNCPKCFHPPSKSNYTLTQKSKAEQQNILIDRSIGKISMLPSMKSSFALQIKLLFFLMSIKKSAEVMFVFFKKEEVVSTAIIPIMK